MVAALPERHCNVPVGGPQPTSLNAARMIGLGVSGLVIAATGTGWAFLINGSCTRIGRSLNKPDDADPPCMAPVHFGLQSCISVQLD